MSFGRAVATVGSLTLLSRLTGFARDVLTAALLGAGPAADAFFVALKLPNFFRRLFAEGAFTVSFVPLFAGAMRTGGRAAALGFAGEALAVLLVVLLPATLLGLVGMPALMVGLAPGLSDEPGRFALAVGMTRLTLPYLLLIAVVALLGGVLNAAGRLAAFAAAPVAFNLTLIAGLLAAPWLGAEAGRTMALAVTVSGMVQLVWLAWACRKAGLGVPLPLSLPLPRPSPEVRRLFRAIGPGALGTGILQVNMLVGVMLASLLPAGGISHLYYADRLNQLPLGVIGIGVGTALLPVLSRCAAAGDRAGLRRHVNRGLEFALALGLPAAAALALIAGPVIAVLFQRGAFGAEDAAATAAALAAFAAGIPAYVLAKVLATAFFARHDPAVPVRAGGLSAVANAGLGLLLLGPLGAAGIALASSLAAWLDAGLLALALRRRGELEPDARLRRRAPRIVLACGAMAGAVLAVRAGLEAWAGPATVALAVLVLAGLAAFLAAAQLLGAVRIGELRGLLRREPEPAS